MPDLDLFLEPTPQSIESTPEPAATPEPTPAAETAPAAVTGEPSAPPARELPPRGEDGKWIAKHQAPPQQEHRVPVEAMLAEREPRQAAERGPAYLDYEPLACVGWNAAEIIVQDVDALDDRLAGSPFRTIGPPANLSFSDKIRAMQVVGPAREVLYLTQIKERLVAFDTPVAACDVDRVFIVILGGTDLDALQDYYHQQFGVARAPVMPSVVSVISARSGLPRDYKHPIAALQVSGQCYIEADQMPAQVAPRPCDPGQLPPGIAMVSFEVERLPGDLPSALAPLVAVRSLSYDGRPARTCVGASGELIELIESG